MDKEALERMETPPDILDQRPKDRSQEDLYWDRYDHLATGLAFRGDINLRWFRERGFELALREGMTEVNLADAVHIGRKKGLGDASREFFHMARQLEKVVQFVPIQRP